ncbi:cell division protein ZapE [Rhodococcus spongiicola]|uniref:Cell division protein ZapE n=1 Tax=Rhodococcus spongiicola TaxID=2487352 RepID=A0A438AP15_9NOCA|nr:cell division protein ZapE [Rhodococcus spongiicola]RVW00389.1 cell division protein ZapE [Rhodococcus spongiicola]
MRWSRRASQSSRPLQLDPAVFVTAAEELGFTLDDAQRRAVAALATADRNLYLWGPAGRGKSWLMATYFAALPTSRKRRIHFHEFFGDLHLAIRRNGNDLSAALGDLLGALDVVCFDEFHVHDPADGKFIARLLPALLDREIRVILTSNYPPQSLLPNPLFHDDFVPTIELIERTLTIVAVDGPVDYRTISSHEAGFAAGFWVSPGSPSQVEHLGLSAPDPDERTTLAPAGHPVHVRRAADGWLWIEFTDLCGRTTAPVDYLALAGEFQKWVISDIPDLRTAGREPAQRFANAIDVLYDRDVTPVFLASTTLDFLTNGAHLPLDMGRIRSRLGQLSCIGPDAAELEVTP